MGDHDEGAMPGWRQWLSSILLPFQIGGAAALLWAAMAADDDGGSSSGSGSGDGDGGDGSDGSFGDEDDLGEKGKRALARERAARAEADKARRAEARRAKDLEDRLAKIEGEKKPATEQALDAARKEADEAARKDERGKADLRVVRASVREMAADRLQDPGDALVHLDLVELTVEDDGEVDRKAITKALDELLKAKPYLGKGKAPKPGSADGGARPPAKGAGEEEISPSERLRRAYAKT